MEELVLSRQAWECVAAHVRRAYPHEAVGLLGGRRDGRVSQAASLPNLAGERAFLADPRAQFEAERAFRRRHLVPLAAYHSHPDGTPTMSPADRALAHPSLLQLVVAISGAGCVDVRAYQPTGRMSEVPLRIGDGPPGAATRPVCRSLWSG